MFDLSTDLIEAFIAGSLGGVATWFGLAFGIRRGCRRLAVRLSDIEERIMTLKQREYAGRRWEQKEFENKVLSEARRPAASRFDNDPPEF
jgi:hypothetical protein